MTGIIANPSVDDRIVVLKLGGSVLDGARGLGSAADEVVRWVGGGYRVVAVVSALSGTTDSLLGVVEELTRQPCSTTLASALATGEDAAASLLAITLLERNYNCVVARADSFRLTTKGASLNAHPTDLDGDWLYRNLSKSQVVILPGFVGRCERGLPTVMGRGGSDLSAVFVADRLRAVECRLVKDVDGVFAWDPKDETSLPPARFAKVSWSDALRVCDVLVQKRAVLYAQNKGQTFTVAGIGGSGTVVGEGPSQLESSARRTRLRDVAS